ncbi:hypothetical protein M758_UG308900 [Ceratodon purpureus]|nr:hypothetical protein M758_UG308900 [Ceratodon purpureus]
MGSFVNASVYANPKHDQFQKLTIDVPKRHENGDIVLLPNDEQCSPSPTVILYLISSQGPSLLCNEVL